MLSAEPDLEASELEDVEVISAIIIWIAFEAASVSRGNDGTQDVDHEDLWRLRTRTRPAIAGTSR